MLWPDEREELRERIRENLIDMISYLIYWGLMFAGILKLLQII